MKEISNMGFTPELCFEHLRYHFAQEVKKREKSFVAEPSQMESMKKSRLVVNNRKGALLACPQRHHRQRKDHLREGDAKLHQLLQDSRSQQWRRQRVQLQGRNLASHG